MGERPLFTEDNCFGKALARAPGTFWESSERALINLVIVPDVSRPGSSRTRRISHCQAVLECQKNTASVVFFLPLSSFPSCGRCVLWGRCVKRFAPLNFWRPMSEGMVAPLISLRPLAVVSPHLAGRQVHCAPAPL